MSALTAWRFSGTEGADNPVLKLKQLDNKQLIDVQEIAMLRWPQYAGAPTAQEHVTGEGSQVSSLVSKLRHAVIDSSMIESVKSDMIPGTSALALLSADAEIGTVAKAFEGQQIKLIRSDLSVQEQDQVRTAFSGPPAGDPRRAPGPS